MPVQGRGSTAASDCCWFIHRHHSASVCTFMYLVSPMCLAHNCDDLPVFGAALFVSFQANVGRANINRLATRVWHLVGIFPIEWRVPITVRLDCTCICWPISCVYYYRPMQFPWQGACCQCCGVAGGPEPWTHYSMVCEVVCRWCTDAL